MEQPTMTIQNAVTRRLLSCLARPTAIMLLLSLCGPGWAWCAGPSSFEIEISDLDKNVTAAKKTAEKPRTGGKKAVPKKRVSPGPVTPKDLEGEFVTYTIRPGDHIYKILTSRFGLSSERAEALIPRILRVNGVRDIRGLQIGRTIRIPVTGSMAAAAPVVAATPASAVAAVQVDAATPAPTVPALTGTATSTPTGPIPSAPLTPEAPVQPVPQAAQAAPPLPSYPPKASKVVLRTVSAGEPAAITDALLDALSLKWSKAHPVTIPVGGSGGASLTIPVDRYFEEGGKRYFLDFSQGDADRATLARLLELAGYRRIAVGGKEDFRAIAGKILKALEIPSEYRKYTLTPTSGGPGAVKVEGYLVVRKGGTGERLFVTGTPVDKAVSDLIQAGEWDIQ
jgi:hypothetical protein